ncbi:MAG: winged helix-turn-helix domain-containing protein [Erysipelotrichaceae bacterium]|nr:winged helix-turn-helix domain-containing protein [Erysipelotrichaceae bacterium]
MRLYCQFTGDYKVLYDGEEVEIIENITSKSGRLLAILMYVGEEGISREKLIELFYGEDKDGALNSLKVMISRLRDQLKEAGLKSEEYISYINNRYKLSKDLDCSSDLKEFYDNCKRAAAVRSEEEALVYLNGALDKVSGLAFDGIEDSYFNEAKEKFHSAYTDVVRRLIAYYKSVNDSNSVMQCCFKVRALYPYEDEWVLSFLEALVQTGRNREAQEEYERYKRRIFDDTLNYPGEALQQYYEMIMNTKKDEVTTDGVLEALKSEKPTSAYRCSFGAFAGNYHLLKRIMEREKIESTLLMCSVVDENNMLVDEFESILKGIDILENSLMYSLRKSDIITRYGYAQMVTLLWKTPKDNAPVVIDRINEAFTLQNRNHNIHVEYTIIDDSSIIPEEDR